MTERPNQSRKREAHASAQTDPEPERAKPASRVRRSDPNRRGRILEAAQTVIAEKGVSYATMRTIALEADVPLGSMTYHFTDREALIAEAFGTFVEGIRRTFIAPLQDAPTREAQFELIVELMCGSAWNNRRNLLLTYELYAWASRCSELAGGVHALMTDFRAALARFFTETEADAVNAFMDGAVIHRAYDEKQLTESETRLILSRMLGGKVKKSASAESL